jgi:hypothetical protein
LRRDGGRLRAEDTARFPSYLRDEFLYGPDARAALRPAPLAGYLLLSGCGVPQGAGRTVQELGCECRELRISYSLLQRPAGRVDLATVIDECLQSALWEGPGD